jgi:hypothetical protein
LFTRTPIQKLSLLNRTVVAVQIGLSLCLAIPGQAAERKVSRGNVAAATARLQPVGSLPDSTRLHLAFSLPLRNQPALAGLLQQIYDPASPNFHRYLTPAEFTEQFGPAKEDYQALIDFAEANHFQVTHTHPNRTLLDVSASVADIRRVLGVHINVYQHPTEGRTFYAPDADPTVDVGVALLAIKGLDNYNLPHPGAKLKPEERKPEEPSGAPHPLGGSAPSPNAGAYIGQDFRNAYAPGVSLDGTGQTAALVEFDSYYPADITTYENTPSPHLRAVPLTNVLVDVSSQSPGLHNLEVSIDIEMLISMAPGLSRIMVYEGPQGPASSQIDDVLNRIATDNLASQISCSWSFSTDATLDQVFLEYAAHGQSCFFASGDSGSNPPGYGAQVDDPYVTIVGGTQLTTGANAVWQSETVWSSSSGGFSTNYPIPAWQAGVNMSLNHGSTTFRNLPDVAMCADNVFVVYNNGSTGAAYGTSCAAPLWAGFTALINQQAASSGNNPVGFLNPAIYAIGMNANLSANCFHDITSGNNISSFNPTNYYAVPGYDLCTGWGTPNGSGLINTLAPVDTLVLLPVPYFAFSGLGGGPFSVMPGSFLLSNTGPASLTWSFGSDSNWLSASPNSGSLGSGATATAAVSLNSAASSLLCGNYTAHLTVTNGSDAFLHYGNVTLQVSDPLAALPATGLVFGGPPSGPFNAAAQTCLLTNASQAPVSWSLLGSPSWLSISPGSGTLVPSGTAAVTCSLNSAATNLPSGAYSGGILFSNVTFGAEEELPALLLAGQLVQNGGFETGDFTDWTTNGNFAFTSVSTSSIAVHSGTYGALLGTFGGPGYLSQTIPTVPGQLYSVSLWLNNPSGAAPILFDLSWGGNTVANLTALAANGWNNLQFTLSATSASTLLEITFESALFNYLGLDDISVTAAPPTIGSVAPAVGPVAGGTLVTIAGTGFQSHARVAFGSAPAASVQFNSTTSIAAVTPASPIGLGPVNVTVTNADGQTAVLASGFLFWGAPVATNFTIQRNPAAGVQVSLATILAHCSVVAGDTITNTAISSTSASNVTITVTNGWVFYPPESFTTADSFTYTVTDNYGLSATGTVAVAIETNNAQSQNLTITGPDNNGSYIISGNGVPGYTYHVQSTNLLNTAWVNTGTTVTADSTGAFQTTVPSGNGVSYRTVYP